MTSRDIQNAQQKAGFHELPWRNVCCRTCVYGAPPAVFRCNHPFHAVRWEIDADHVCDDWLAKCPEPSGVKKCEK